MPGIANETLSWPEERLYVLPMEDGDTVIVFKEENQPNFLRWPISPELEDEDTQIVERITDYCNMFPDEYALKVALFKEMSRSLPSWAEIKCDWLNELLRMAVRGDELNPKKELSSSQLIVLKWLLFTFTEPKITKLVKTCEDAALEPAGPTYPKPSMMFLLEYKDTLEGDLSYGFLPVSPQDVFSTVYVFPEAAKGCQFTMSLAEALAKTSGHTLSLSGPTQHRYRVVLMLEYLTRPGIQSMEVLSSQFSSKFMNPGFYKLEETKNARVRAILLYKAPLIPEQTIEPPTIWFIFSLFSIAIMSHTLYKLKYM